MPIDNTIIPWGVHPIKPWVVDELKKRSTDYGIVSSSRKAVRSTWCRFFSNGIPTKIVNDRQVTDNPNGYEGFLMFGVNGFNDSHGFNSSGQSVIGKDANGKSHTLSGNQGTSFPHRPPPSIESVDVDLYGGQNSTFSGLCRRVDVKWKCHSLDQLNYLTPYFLSPRVTCCVEWGWDSYNPTSLIDYKDIDEMRRIFGDANAILKKSYISNGNYDAAMGYVIDYGYTLASNGSYECRTSIVSVSWLYDGMEYGNQNLKRKKSDGTWEQIESFSDFIQMSGLVNDRNKKSLSSPVVDVSSNFPKKDGRTFSFPTKSKSPSPGVDWIRMDYLVELINYYFKVNFNNVFVESTKDKTSNTSRFVWRELDISNVLISAHPGMKSISPEVLVPNRFAPKYIADSNIKSTGKLHDASIDKVSFLKKFGKIDKVINSAKFTDAYDDLFSLITSGVSAGATKNSFPLFEAADISNEYYKDSGGYVGRLADLYISTDFVKKEVSSSHKVKDLLNSILTKISTALSSVPDLKIVPDTVDEKKCTVIDTKLSPPLIRGHKYTDSLIKINVQSSDSAYLLGANFDVKMSQEMANQVLFSVGKDQLAGRTTSQTDTPQFGQFLPHDRLCQAASCEPDKLAPSDPSTEESKQSRNDKTPGFIPCELDGITYYLVEYDDGLMKKIVTDDPSPKAVYLNSAIMAGSKFEMEMLGIAGWSYLGQFVLDNVPKSYSYEKSVWQISTIKHTISGGTWKTTIGAQVRPISTMA